MQMNRVESRYRSDNYKWDFLVVFTVNAYSIQQKYTKKIFLMYPSITKFVQKWMSNLCDWDGH